MIILGLILVVAVAVVVVAVLQTGADPVHLDLHWFTIDTNGNVMFLAGAAALLVLLVGIWALRLGIRRARARRREMRELRQRAAEPRPAPTKEPAAPAPSRPSNADDHYDSAPKE